MSRIRQQQVLPGAAALILFVMMVQAPTGTAAEEGQRLLTPATITVQLPAELGEPERPAVEMNHAAHTTALAEEGCKTCHTVDAMKGLTPQLTATFGVTGRQDIMDAFHNTCITCHRQRAESSLSSGPVTCGECHVRRPPADTSRAAMGFDYSLHARHVQAFPEHCDTCHHVFDEAQQKLRYEKGAEEACRACHGEQDVEKKLSLGNAVHRRCIGCHLQRTAEQLDSGPTLCIGCHDAEQQRAVRRLAEIPRLLRGQPDRTWIAAPEARSQLVGFDHLGHELTTQSCSDCHHQTLKPCQECHTLGGSEEGAGVTLAQAYHHSSSEHSCVGCHNVTADRLECAGCHAQSARMPGERACRACHSGPLPPAPSPEPSPEPEIRELPPPELVTVELAVLPELSDSFPETVLIETVLIDGLVNEYEPATLPHAKIVRRLDDAVRKSKLASRFHGDTDTLCAGCHHHSPVGTRPPPCRACHGDEAVAGKDQPALKVAYHRQCIGCHQQMSIKEQGCTTGCHKPREVQ